MKQILVIIVFALEGDRQGRAAKWVGGNGLV